MRAKVATLDYARMKLAACFFAFAALALGAVSCHETTGTLVSSSEVQTPDAARGEAGAPLFRPTSDTTWQVQLTGTIDTSFDVQMYEVDLFALDAATAATLHGQGRVITCYVSVGTAENYRADYASFPAAAVGNALSDYPQEHWLDIRDRTVRQLMAQRLELGAQAGCDAVELSNLQAHTEDSGFSLTQADDLDYARWLIGESHARGLSAGISASDDLAPLLAGDAEWGLTAECLASGACDAWQAFTALGKAVFMIEYGSNSDVPALCPEAARLGFSLVIKRRALDAFRVGCPAGDAGS
jgi:hypothetical protein